ncbi:hypothetical protein EVAR_58502_1 [Eumeta japonica]|uniref:Uncharacterized protein n=1 Tax=Eumeta variegata TaxID=151549 RepID=A0A4C1Z4Y4_EUMVA|nr:hypothetical protein EVAR_58502_1 [Eumeta japonica]
MTSIKHELLPISLRKRKNTNVTRAHVASQSAAGRRCRGADNSHRHDGCTRAAPPSTTQLTFIRRVRETILVPPRRQAYAGVAACARASAGSERAPELVNTNSRLPTFGKLSPGLGATEPGNEEIMLKRHRRLINLNVAYTESKLLFKEYSSLARRRHSELEQYVLIGLNKTLSLQGNLFDETYETYSNERSFIGIDRIGGLQAVARTGAGAGAGRRAISLRRREGGPPATIVPGECERMPPDDFTKICMRCFFFLLFLYPCLYNMSLSLYIRVRKSNFRTSPAVRDDAAPTAGNCTRAGCASRGDTATFESVGARSSKEKRALTSSNTAED